MKNLTSLRGSRAHGGGFGDRRGGGRRRLPRGSRARVCRAAGRAHKASYHPGHFKHPKLKHGVLTVRGTRATTGSRYA